MAVKLPFSMHYLPSSKKLGFRQRKRQLTEVYAQKAKDALAKRTEGIAQLAKPQQKTEILSQNYTIHEQAVRYLSTNFSWTANQVSNSIKINLNYDLNDADWTITAQGNEIWKEENQYSIEVSPVLENETWLLSTNKVRLCANDLNMYLFTALWKAFEEKVIEFTGMADLVQLSGYYQYNPRIKGILTFHPALQVEPFWRVIQYVVGGLGVATQLSAQSLALLWGVNTDDVFSYLQSLRQLGYEVRNHNTNPQIPKGEYLIPYAFPTLTPKSVQLRKNLGKVIKNY
jgi:DNA (cytosine-5)-methyltransferase 1